MWTTLAPLGVEINPGMGVLIGGFALVLFFVIIFFVKQYRRCPSNRILVVYGKVAGGSASKCLHGGGAFVWPLIQDYAYLTLEPLAIEINLVGSLSKRNIRVNVPSTFTVGISTNPTIMKNAAERLLFLPEQKVKEQSQDIILGQLRLVIATLSIEEINQDREKFLELVNKNVGMELNKIGLDVINVNIRDITDESGYIDAIGKRAAAQAINQAKIEVAEESKLGETGVAKADKDREVQVAMQHSESEQGRKEAEKNQRVTVSRLEAEAMEGEATAERNKQVAVMQQKAEAAKSMKAAETDQRVRVAVLEATAIEGENVSKAKVADANAELEKRMADARQMAEVAKANAARMIFDAEKERETARLRKEELAAQEVAKLRIEVEAEARAEQLRRVARGEADAILQRYEAEATGVKRVLEAKAAGYQALIGACKDQPQLAPTLLIIEKLPELVSEQVKAIQNLKIDKITVWDGGHGGNGGSTANFLSSLIGSLPAVHELAQQAGIQLPEILGKVNDKPDAGGAAPSAPAAPVPPRPAK